MTLKVWTVPRPFLLSVVGGSPLLLSSDAAQRVIDGSTVVSATPFRVTVESAGTRSVLRPATLGGGPAFIVERRRV